MSRDQKLLIQAAGLCCSLGYHLDAAVCGLRANIDHFQESAFNSLASDPVNVAALPDNTFGAQRLQRWVEYAIRDCLSDAPEPADIFDSRRTALVVLAPEHTRPHCAGEEWAQCVRNAMSSLQSEYGVAHQGEPPNLTVISSGRASLVAALRHANAELQRGMAHVLLIGVDSFLNAPDINNYLQEERLLVPGNTNGFLPGEAAAVLLIARASTAGAGLRIAGSGLGKEKGTLDGSVPNRSEGLTAAIRQACAEAQVAPHDLEFRLSDQNGEHFFTKDATNAITRVMAGGQLPKHLTLADKVGEIGAATGPAMLAWLLRDMRHAQYTPGRTGLVHLANDEGVRNAVVIQYIEE